MSGDRLTPAGRPRPGVPCGPTRTSEPALLMTTIGTWVEGARPRTLPAAVAPVLVGSGIAASVEAFRWWSALLALVVALAVQVGVNYANDYSDGVRGTDQVRV